VKTVAIVARPNKPEAVTVAREVKAHFPEVEFLVEEHLGVEGGWPWVSNEELGRRAELVLVLGGDGTLIHAAHMLKGRGIPMLGVNLGSLGFMVEVQSTEVIPALTAALEGRVSVDSRMKLTCRLYREAELLFEDEVLNDVVINKSALARIADHETWLDGAFMALFKADGVIFSTPTGSTAYSLSAGGPIVHPSVDCVVVTPICPHALTQRPIVVPGDQLLTVRLTSEVSDVYLTIDGQSGLPLKQGDRIEVQKANNRVALVRNSTLDYFGVLRQKLHWGER
jgi:NAD+ kinase